MVDCGSGDVGDFPDRLGLALGNSAGYADCVSRDGLTGLRGSRDGVARSRTQGAVLRGVIASVAVLAGAVLLVYGLAYGKRSVTVKEASTTIFPARPLPPDVLNDLRRRHLPLPPPEPPKVVRVEAEVELNPEWRLVRDITVGALRREADGLHRASFQGSGPALCPT